MLERWWYSIPWLHLFPWPGDFGFERVQLYLEQWQRAPFYDKAWSFPPLFSSLGSGMTDVFPASTQKALHNTFFLIMSCGTSLRISLLLLSLDDETDSRDLKSSSYGSKILKTFSSLFVPGLSCEKPLNFKLFDKKDEVVNLWPSEITSRRILKHQTLKDIDAEEELYWRQWAMIIT